MKALLLMIALAGVSDKLAEHRYHEKIDSMKIGDTASLRAWGMLVDKDGHCWIPKHETLYKVNDDIRNSNGNRILLTKVEGGFNVDITYCDFKWHRSNRVYDPKEYFRVIKITDFKPKASFK